MTYKLNPEVKKIAAPIRVRFSEGGEMRFADGAALADAEFAKNYLVEGLTVDDGYVVLTLRENDRVNSINWVGEEQVSFF